jgi:uncharacterized protein (DUF362 family)
MSRVAVIASGSKAYPLATPFHPPERYPEMAASQLRNGPVDPTNGAYASVRDALWHLGLDAPRRGTPSWSPFRDLARPGDMVLVKPNWVAEGHHRDGTWEQIITHGAVLRAVLDYVALALEGRGTIALADGPMQSSDFEAIVSQSGVRGIERFYRSTFGGIRLEVLDLRETYLETRDDVIVRRHDLPGDPRGSGRIDLGTRSQFYGFRGEGRYYGADYDTSEVNDHHRAELQEYRLSGTALSADLILDVPKLKTHQKVGVTLALKGVVGLNCGRNWLPHRTQGTPEQGGDQFAESGVLQRAEHWIIRSMEQASLRFPTAAPSVYRVAKRVGRKVFGATDATIRGGGWHGNDTIWRMVLDINRALAYGDLEGRLRNTPRRRFCVVDGIVAGEGTGPIYADARPCGVVVAGANPVAVDVACAELMGFDPATIPMLANALAPHPLPLFEGSPDDVRIESNLETLRGSLARLAAATPFEFRAPLGWVGHIERRVPAGARE